MRIGYGDPPYPGQSKLYKDHADYAGEVDLGSLVARLHAEFDGFVLHTSSNRGVIEVTRLLEAQILDGTVRVMAWVKPFAAFKRNIPVAYAWEPVFVKAARKPVVSTRLTMRDWIAEKITLRRGLAGAKPEAVCHWGFEVVGARPEDDLVDLFPGTGAVSAAWSTWCRKFRLPEAA